MRTKKTLINMIIALINTILTLIIGYIVQIIFTKKLGLEYLGINGLFSNIISILNVVELGIGTAIIFNMYEPVAKNDIDTLSSLTNYYKKVYTVIAIVVSLLGIIIIPFIPLIIGQVSINDNLTVIYILILLEVVVSYFLSYKRTILYVNQENYILNIIHIMYIILMNSFIVVILLTSSNYILYLLIKTIFKLLENVVISIYVNKKYPYINNKDIKKVDISILNDIKKKVKALFTHKIGGYIVNGTDNILLTKLFSVIVTGLYSNYYYVISSANIFLQQIIQSSKASVGNLLVTESSDRCLEVYKRINFLNFWIYSLCAIGFASVIQQFITFSYGKEYLLSLGVVYILSLNFFIQGMRQSVNIYKETAGIFYEDRYVPIIESILNIVLSIIFAKLIGVAGVFLGTVCSSLLLHFYSYPKYVYNKIFKRSGLEYIFNLLKQTLIFVILLILVTYINNIYVFENVILDFLKNGILAFLIVNSIYLVIFRNNKELHYYQTLIKSILKIK